MQIACILKYQAQAERRNLMAKVYAALILKGLKTIDDVPAKLRDAVEEILQENA